MRTRALIVAGLSTLSLAGSALAQPYPLVDLAADRLIQRYQMATCQQLWQERAAARTWPRPPAEQRAIDLLHQDPGARAAFINRIAAPIANKLFECGMIP
jgi:hypothetical protein